MLMQFPHTVTIDRSLKVEVYLHEFFLGDRNRSCWTYLTQGMTAHGQREMALSLLVDDDADPTDLPKTPLKMFKLLHERRSGDRQVDLGGSTRLGQTGIFGFPCLFYVPAIQFADLPNLDDVLGLILVHEEEFEYARQYGLTRLLSRLGKFCSSFPYPTWNTQARPSLFNAGTRELSLLTDAGHISLDHSAVEQAGEQLQLHLSVTDLSRLRKALDQLELDQLAIFNTAFSLACDASLYWQEGQQQPGAYAAPDASGGIIGGSFISVCRTDAGSFAITEDGYAASFDPGQFQQLIEAVRNTEPTEITLNDSQRFCLTIQSDTSRLPPARPYLPIAAWRSIETAEEPAPAPELPRVMMREFVNLSGDNSLAERVNRDELLDWFERIHAALQTAMSDEEERFDFELELALYPHQLLVKVIAGIELNPAFVDFTRGLVEKIEPCAVTSQIRVRLPFSINPEE